MTAGKGMHRIARSNRAMRIGLFAHSTNPRGGVVHVLEAAESLARLGHEVVVHAPNESGSGFFRRSAVEQRLIPVSPVTGGLAAHVKQRVREYADYLRPGGDQFDVYHAHDGISGNALADLTDEGVIPGFVRTVHHLDTFSDSWVEAAQERSVTAAAAWACVSQVWADILLAKYQIEAPVVPNGVDLTRFSPAAATSDEELAVAHVLRDRDIISRPLFLAVGGVEKRKNTVNLLRAFLAVRSKLGSGTLVIAGGASLLDHSTYRCEFDQLLAATAPELAQAVILTGPLPDDVMPSMYRAADALVFPSLAEGFGLAVVEAMACGTPVIVSNQQPFTEYLGEADALWVEPYEVETIRRAMLRVTSPSVRQRLRAAGLAVSRRFPWERCATGYVGVYRRLLARTGGRHARDAFSSAMA